MNNPWELQLGGLTYSESHTKETNARDSSGRFVKGMTSCNKGKKPHEWMSEEGRKRSIEAGTKNLKTGYHGNRSPNAGRKPIPVIGIDSNCKVKRYASLKEAQKATGAIWTNIRRSCELNRKQTPHLQSGMINTDHACLGIRWYYEDDVQIWTSKTRK